MSTISNSGNFPTYRFYVTFPVGSITYEVFPLNFLSTLLVDELEVDQVFYRRKFSGTLIFGTDSFAIDDSGVKQNRRDDWDLLYSIDPCERIDFSITKTVSGVTTVYWEGYFSTSEGKFDLDNCTFEVTPLADDNYTSILEQADIKYNIIDVQPSVTTTSHIPGRTDIVYTHNKWLLDVIEFLAEKIYDPLGTIVGDAVVNATIFTDDPNYVTLTATNYLKYLTIAQKSDIIRPTASNSATTIMLSWNELMYILWTMFQIRWIYDGAGTFTVEHTSYFTKNPGLDLRTQLMTVASNKYSYIKDQMPKYEKFSFMEADGLDFVGYPIYYDSACVNQDPKTNITEQSIGVTTDLEYIQESPDAITDEGFVILCNYNDGGSYYVEFDLGMMSSTVRLNVRLSWANLHNAYFRHNRILIEGYLNGGYPATTFWSAQKTKIQECNAIVCSDAYDPDDEITTELGETYFGGEKATVKESSLSPSGMIKFQLLYGPADNTNTGVDDDCVVLWGYLEITGVRTLNLTLNSNIPLPGDIGISYREFVYNGAGVLQCTGGWNGVTLTAGSLETIITHTICQDLVNPGDCVKLEFMYCDDDICAVNIDTESGDDCCDNAIIYTINCV